MSYLINTYWNPIVNAGTEHPIHLTLIYPILITLEYPILMTLEHPILITLEHPVLMTLEVGKNTKLFLNDQIFSEILLKLTTQLEYPWTT